MSTKYFSNDEQVFHAMDMPNEKVIAAFGSLVGRRNGSFYRLVGFAKDASNVERAQYVGAKPVTRVINFKSNPSLHMCDSRCRNAKGHSCECSCGGKFHGAG